MTFLPIVERELRVAARRPATHWTRFCAALATLIIWLLLALSTPQWVPVPQLSKNLFIATGLLAFGFCALAGVILTADCLSLEKREGTLGLLFLTELKSHDIVFGKLAATSVHSLYGLLAIFPVMALPLLLGGVTGAEFGPARRSSFPSTYTAPATPRLQPLILLSLTQRGRVAR